MPEPDDLAALEAELQLVATGAWTLTPEWADRIIAALRRAKEWKRLLEESDNYGAFCRMKQTIAELRAGLEDLIAVQNGPPLFDTALEWEKAMHAARDLLARTAPPPEGK